METVIANIMDALREQDALDPQQLDRIIRERSSEAHDGRRVFAKKRILPFYLDVKANNPELWHSWNIDDDLDARFVRTLQMKPRRTASGVATITVLTKPWPCANNCLYCPNDPLMPKSYLSDEPACQRASRNRFHPYLQVASRLRTLQRMGHATDKIELIVLGGTWNDYPAAYREWFVSELFRALDSPREGREAALALADETGTLPSAEDDHPDVEKWQRENEKAAHRVVGLVVETRPDAISCDALRDMRRLGCTKVQLGVQSIDPGLLKQNGRRETPEGIAEALQLARLFGFKTHAHFMINLFGATPESDKADYAHFMEDPAFRPDEVKLYPCALVSGTQLQDCYEEGSWRPYSEEELVDVLSACMKATPSYARVSRMIRDISARDILFGNKKTNLRQIVEAHLRDTETEVSEIRYREIGTEPVELDAIFLDVRAYETELTDERFLQWVTPAGKIVGFLRLSLPRQQAHHLYPVLPVGQHDAMIREVHVYGFATAISGKARSAQHRGLGAKLVERACEIAREAGYTGVNVISAVGTRDYYRKLGFADAGLYQRRALV